MGIQRDSPKNSPKASPRKKTTLQHVFDLDSNPYAESNLSSPRPSNGSQSQFDSEYEDILSAISYCNFIFTFTDPLESPSQQDLKRHKLIQVLSLTKSSKKPLHEQLPSPLMSMVSANLFRLLPPLSCTSTISDMPDDEELSTFTPVWPHSQIVYDILHRLVLNVDTKTLGDYIDHHFILNLLFLFQSEDPRERELKECFPSDIF